MIYTIADRFDLYRFSEPYCNSQFEYDSFDVDTKQKTCKMPGTNQYQILDRDGNIVKEGDIKNGNYKKNIYKNGKMIHQNEYKNGKLHGNIILFNDEWIENRVEYEDGVPIRGKYSDHKMECKFVGPDLCKGSFKGTRQGLFNKELVEFNGLFKFSDLSPITGDFLIDDSNSSSIYRQKQKWKTYEDGILKIDYFSPKHNRFGKLMKTKISKKKAKKMNKKSMNKKR